MFTVFRETRPGDTTLRRVKFVNSYGPALPGRGLTPFDLGPTQQPCSAQNSGAAVARRSGLSV